MAEQKDQAEAEYRSALTCVRENGESIALLGGDEEERGVRLAAGLAIAAVLLGAWLGRPRPLAPQDGKSSQGPRLPGAFAG